MCEVITPALLAAELRGSTSGAQEIVVIDLRPSSHFYRGHIKGAVSVPARPAALKAADADAALSELEQQQIDESARHALQRLALVNLLVLYDGGGPTGVRDGPAFILGDLLMQGLGCDVSVLEGGYRAVSSSHASLCSKPPASAGHSSLKGVLDLTPKGGAASAAPATCCLTFDNGTFSIWVGGARDASSRDFLTRERITHVLNTTRELPNRFGTDTSLCYLRLGLADEPTEPLGSRLNECIEFLDTARRTGARGALVHCFMGRSRSVSVAAAYAVHAMGVGAREALGMIKARRPEAGPNYGFVQQLKKWAARHPERGGQVAVTISPLSGRTLRLAIVLS